MICLICILHNFFSVYTTMQGMQALCANYVEISQKSSGYETCFGLLCHKEIQAHFMEPLLIFHYSLNY